MIDSSESLSETKKLLRTEVLARRDAIPLEERRRKSALICERLLEKLGEAFDGDRVAKTGLKENPLGFAATATPFAGKVIAVFQAMRSEVDLDSFDRSAYAAGARVCFPCMMDLHAARSSGQAAYPGQKSFMVFREVPQDRFESGDVPFAVNPLKFYEPDDPLLADFPLVEPESFDVVIVPLVAFDEHFNRMGYGGGNYDSLLPRLRPDACIMGVAFAEQQVEKIPLEPHDLALPLIISA